MLVNIFRGGGRVFGFTAAADAGGLPVVYGPWASFKSIEMHQDEPQAGVDVNECLADIEAHGFHLTDAHERITDKAAGTS